MSGFPGRRGPNVSQYLADLNTIPTAQDMAASAQPASSFDEDIALFTNLDDFDFGFDAGEINGLMQSPLEFDQAQEERVRRQNASAYRHNSQKHGDFINSGEFQYPGFNFPNLVDPAATNFPPGQVTQPFNVPTQHSSPSVTSPTSPTDASVSGGSKRKLDSDMDANGSQGLEEGPRMAAEEDKRRRNTAASARFRIKKKQREQALEKTAKDMTDRVNELESKINQLETENRWLKELLTEKNEKSAELSKQRLHKQSAEARSLGDHTTGVGTEGKVAKA